MAENENEHSITDFLAAPIEGLGFSSRVCELFKREGIDVLNDLIRRSGYDLREVRGFGPKAIEEVNRILGRFSYTLDSLLSSRTSSY